MKSASGKRPPDEAHGPGKEAIGPQQRGLGKSRKEGAHRSAFKIRLNGVKHFRNFAVVLAKLCLFFAILVQNSAMLMDFFRNFSNLYGKDPNPLDSQFLGISQRIFLKFSENDFRKVTSINYYKNALEKNRS